MRSSLLVVLCLAAACVHGHFLLTAPATRGMDEDKMNQAPCGGFNTPSVNRTSWPLGTPIHITSYHANAVIKSYLSLSANPQNLSDFHEYSSISQAPVGKQSLDFKLNTPSPDFLTQLGIQNASALVDKLSTIMVSYDGGDGVLYQCGDVKLIAAASNGTANGTTSGTASGTVPVKTSTTPVSSAAPLLSVSCVWVFALFYLVF